jgi:sodium/potassium-transporting ATPase subunit beta
MQGLFVSIDEAYPKWQLGESLIGTNPGLGFRPMAKDVEAGSIIMYSSSKQNEIDIWVKQLDEFLKREFQFLYKYIRQFF